MNSTALPNYYTLRAPVSSTAVVGENPHSTERDVGTGWEHIRGRFGDTAAQFPHQELDRIIANYSNACEESVAILAQGGLRLLRVASHARTHSRTR